MSEINILSEFKTQIISFFDELVEQFPSEADLIIARLVIANNQIPIKTIMDTFIEQLDANDQEIRKMIKNRDETFFLEHDILNGAKSYNFDNRDAVSSKANHFKNIWLSDSVDDEMKATFWQWFDAFIFIGDKYKKL